MGILNYVDEKTEEIGGYLDKIDDEAREIANITKTELNYEEESDIKKSVERIKDYCKDIEKLL